MTLLGVRAPLDDRAASHVPVSSLLWVRPPLAGHDSGHQRRQRGPVENFNVQLGARRPRADPLEPREARERIPTLPRLPTAQQLAIHEHVTRAFAQQVNLRLVRYEERRCLVARPHRVRRRSLRSPFFDLTRLVHHLGAVGSTTAERERTQRTVREGYQRDARQVRGAHRVRGVDVREDVFQQRERPFSRVERGVRNIRSSQHRSNRGRGERPDGVGVLAVSREGLAHVLRRTLDEPDAFGSQRVGERGRRGFAPVGEHSRRGRYPPARYLGTTRRVRRPEARTSREVRVERREDQRPRRVVRFGRGEEPVERG